MPSPRSLLCICRLIVIVALLGLASRAIADGQMTDTKSECPTNSLRMFVFGVSPEAIAPRAFPFSAFDVLKIPYVAKVFKDSGTALKEQDFQCIAVPDSCPESCAAATGKATAVAVEVAADCVSSPCAAGSCSVSACPIFSSVSADCSATKNTVAAECPVSGTGACQCPALTATQTVRAPGANCQCGTSCQCASTANAHVAALHKQLVKTATENAELRARHEAAREVAQLKDRFVQELVESRIESARFQARLELAAEKEELVESVIDTLVQNAILEVRLDAADERQGLISEIAHLHAEREHTARIALPPAVNNRPVPHSIVQALEKSRAENESLKERIAQLEKRIQGFARTAERAEKQQKQRIDR